jgi:hypothetical protein
MVVAIQSSRSNRPRFFDPLLSLSFALQRSNALRPVIPEWVLSDILKRLRGSLGRSLQPELDNTLNVGERLLVVDFLRHCRGRVVLPNGPIFASR